MAIGQKPVHEASPIKPAAPVTMIFMKSPLSIFRRFLCFQIQTMTKPMQDRKSFNEQSFINDQFRSLDRWAIGRQDLGAMDALEH